MNKPLVAIVGRPNVGKSTLFNRIARRRMAIVSDVPGTTRDRIATEINWGEHSIILVDTGGLLPFPDTDLWDKIKAQVEMAMAEADVIVMVVDSTEAITSTDRDIADLLRRIGKPVILAANKADNPGRQKLALEFYELGLGDPIAVSAYHNWGVEGLIGRVVDHLPSYPATPEQEGVMKLAIVGRTNVGKSTLLNSILGYKRAIVSETPGTTRDAVDSLFTLNGRSILLIDTAGIRRRGRVEPGIERYSVLRAIMAIERADVVLMVLDASELVTGQDTHIAGYVLEAHKGMVLTVNKWDLANGMGLEQAELLREVRRRYRFIPHVPVCFISALEGEGIPELLSTAKQVYQQWTKEIPRGELNRVVTSAIAKHPPPASGKRGLKIHRAAQEGTSPPTFIFYVNRSDLVHFSYQRYLENVLHRAFGFQGVHPKLIFKGRGKR